MSESQPNNTRPWMIAAWPGMGNVAVIAAGYLVQKLGMTPIGEMTARGYFDIQHVSVSSGLIQPPRMPRSVFYQWKNPSGGRDLIVSLSEAQPAARTYAFAHEVMERAAKFNVERVFAFASLASQLHPTQDPRIYGAATSQPLLDELIQRECTTLEDGQIGGLNGVILGAALESGVHGACLLAEIPFFAAGVPNPKAAKAVLEMFTDLAGIEVDFADLQEHSEAVEHALLDLMERMQRQGIATPEMEENAEAGEEETPAPETEKKPETKERVLDYNTRTKLEQMFEDARRDRSKAVVLKQELDKLGVFKQYENRFLDLFRRAE